MENRAGAKKKLSRLIEALGLFDRVSPDVGLACLSDARLVRPELLPVERPVLRRTVALALLVLENAGVTLRDRGAVRLPTMLVNMETAFESYVRQVVQAGLAAYAGTRVLDGNKSPPNGASGTIFKPESVGKYGNSGATPDTVIEHDGKIRLIIETKYKPQKGMPVREELDQVHAYAGAFQCKNVVLVYPSTSGVTEVVQLGEVSDIKIHLATIDLGAVDFLKAESDFIENMRGLSGLS